MKVSKPWSFDRLAINNKQAVLCDLDMDEGEECIPV